MKQHRLLKQQAECAQEHISRIKHEQEQGLYPKYSSGQTVVHMVFARL